MAHTLLLQLRLILVLGLPAAISVAPLAARTRHERSRETISISVNEGTAAPAFARMPRAECLMPVLLAFMAPPPGV